MLTWLVPALAAAGGAAAAAVIGSRQNRHLRRRIDFLVSASAFTVLRLEPAARAQELQGMKELIEQAAGNRSLSRGKRANAALVKQVHDLVLSREAEADR